MFSQPELLKFKFFFILDKFQVYGYIGYAASKLTVIIYYSAPLIVGLEMINISIED